jgi:hypothetical protein
VNNPNPDNDNNVSSSSHYPQNKIMNGDSGITVAKVAIIANSQVNQQQLDLVLPL